MYLYEERITLWKAIDLDEALRLSEVEANAYASEGEAFLGLSQAYELFDELDANGIEVFSLLRESDLSPQEYLRAHFCTETERTQ